MKASKKIQKRLQEQQVLEELKKQQEEEGTEQQFFQPKKQTNFFTMDDNSDSEESQENDSEKEREEEEEKKRQQEEEEALQKQQQKSKKNKKKNKKKKQQENQEEEEDLEKMLQEMKEQNQKLKQQNQEEESKDNVSVQEQEEFKQEEFIYQQGNLTLYSPLQLVPSKFNYNKELQKYFKGAKLIENKQEDEIQDQRILKQMIPMSKKKYFKLIYDKKYYRPATERFKFEPKNEKNAYNQTQFIVQPTHKYEKLQETYQGLKNSMDPQNTFDFVQRNPDHVDALYDISEFFKLQGNFKESNHILSHILFIYEDSFGLLFRQIYEDTENKFCLLYHQNPYAKTFFKALLQFLHIVGKKGCFRSALEFNKFLLKLNPVEDPVGSLLCLDYYALSSKQFSYLNYFIENFAKSVYKSSKHSILYLPNMIYSLALSKFSDNSDHLLMDVDDLIEFKKEDFDNAIDFNNVDHLKSSHNTLILLAILLYPKLIVDISEMNEFNKKNVFSGKLKGLQKKKFQELLSHQFFLDNLENLPFYGFLKMEDETDVEGLKKIFEIYTERTKIVYKNDQVVLWLKAAIGFLLQEIEEREFAYDEFVAQLCEPAEKNILPFRLCKYRKLLKSNFSDKVDRLDLQNIEQDEMANFQNQMQQQQQDMQGNLNPLNTNQGILRQFLESALPWVNLPQSQGQNQQQQQEQNQNVIYQDDDVQIEDENDDGEWEEYNPEDFQ